MIFFIKCPARQPASWRNSGVLRKSLAVQSDALCSGIPEVKLFNLQLVKPAPAAYGKILKDEVVQFVMDDFAGLSYFLYRECGRP